MSVIDVLIGRRGGREYTVHVGGPLRDMVMGMTVEEMYRTQPELQAVVSFLARNVAQLPLKCYTRVSDDDRPRDTEGPLPLLLGEPGGGVTTYDLILGTIADTCLYGRYLWWVLPSADSASGWEIRRIPPSWIQKTKTIDGFTPSSYVLRNPTARGRQIEVPAYQFVTHVEYNPGRPCTPLSPVDSLKQVLAERASSREYRNKVWRNGGWFSRYIKRPKDAPDWGEGGEHSARARFARSWKARFAGKDGTDTGGTPILEDGMELVETRLNAKEAEWAESMRLTREDVAAAYHVNPSMVWSNDGQTYASVKENARSLYSDTLGPTLAMLKADIALQLVPMIGADPRCYAEFDLTAKLAGSFEEQASVLSQSVGGPWMLRNEARAKQNLPAIPGGDELIVPMNVTEGGLASPHDTDPTQTYSGALLLLADLLAQSKGRDTEPARQRPKGAGPGQRTVSLRSRASREVTADIERVLRAFYGRQARSIANQLAGMDPADIATEGTMEWWHKDRWVRELADDLAGAATETARRTATEAMGALGAEPSALDAEKLAKLIGGICRRRADNIVESTLEQLAKDLSEAGELDAETVRATVAESYERLMDSRVERNGGSLATAVTNSATVEGARQSGVECLKEWVASGHNTRSSHARLDGQRVKIGEKFSNGAMWPGDAVLPPEESCNCRCTTAIIAGEDRASSKEMRKYRKDVDNATKALNKARIQYQKKRDEANFQATIGKLAESYSTVGRITAEWKTNPLGKELVAAARCSANGHDVEFFHTEGSGKQPDIRLDGEIYDFKRPESIVPRAVYTLIKKAHSQGAKGAVIDLALDRISLADAMDHARRAIEDGLMESGYVMILDWHGKEHVI